MQKYLIIYGELNYSEMKDIKLESRIIKKQGPQNQRSSAKTL